MQGSGSPEGTFPKGPTTVYLMTRTLHGVNAHRFVYHFLCLLSVSTSHRCVIVTQIQYKHEPPVCINKSLFYPRS